MIELVVFDMAGTTVHDGDGVNSSFRAALSAVGVEADRAVVNGVMGLPEPEAIRRLLAGSGRPFAGFRAPGPHSPPFAARASESP